MKRRDLLSGLGAMTALGGCASAAPPVLRRASEPLIPSLRMPADASFETWARHLHLPTMRGRPVILALSGGGEDGAFGAGVLSGWSETGRRPTFDLVTGISTGALMAPFAFLGPSQDLELRRIYTSYGEEDILRRRIPGGLVSDSLASSAPMRTLIARHLSDPVIARVAEEHSKGQRLFVVTSNLDTGRPWVWDMGAIAAAGRNDLFRGVTLASASIPGLFPPVTIRIGDVAETHVDGGVNMQLLAVPEAAFANLAATTGRGGHLYILVNNTLEPPPTPVSRRAIPIMQQTFTTMVRAQAAQAVASAGRYAARTGMDFSVATIGRDFDTPWDPSNRFDPAYMRALFAYGRKRAATGQVWSG
ncbi:patatin-like phospholipase family protein [Palleronia rufa]|uniref:patatin-like phospholipase family protein n=1 Tax=Palleronia rufa TaxID=1530186 RepID=UPI00068D5BC7|nr:patatin-like phospholipase family protein [Palleronia rufa]